MSKRHRIFFRIGAWALVATAAIHMAGQLAPRPVPANDTEATLFKLLESYKKDMGAGMLRSTMDFLNGFSVSFSILLAWLGVVALVVLRKNVADGRFMLRFARVCAVFAVALLIVSVVDFFLPPTVCIAVIVVGFLGASLGRAEP